MNKSHRIQTGDWVMRRFEVFERDHFTCQYCGQHAPNITLEVEHVKPVVEGGTNDLENLLTSCSACNRGKNTLWLSRQYEVVPGLRKGLKRGGQKERVYDFLVERPGRDKQEIEISLHLAPYTANTYLRRLNRLDLVYQEGHKWFAKPLAP